MIEQIRDILTNIENSNSRNEKINYSLEACKLIFENNKIETIDFQSLEAEDMILDSILFMDEIVKYNSSFLNHSLKYLEADLKGSDFESEIQSNLKLLQDLQIKFKVSSEEYPKLKKIKKEAEEIQFAIDSVQAQIDEYKEVDLGKVKLEKETMALQLVELGKIEGNNLTIYKKHLEENKSILVSNAKLLDLSAKIRQDLDEMDHMIKAKIIGNLNG